MQRIKLPQINGMGDNQTGTIRLPMGYTYRRIYLHHKKLKMNEIKQIRVVVNGNVIQTFPTGGDLCLLNYFFGMNPDFPDQDYGVSALAFDYPHRRNRLAEEQYSLVTGFRPEGYIGNTVRNATLEFEFGSISDSNPVLEAYAVVWNNPPVKHSGLCAHWYHYPQYNAGAAGKFIIDDLPRQVKWADIIIKPGVTAQGNPDQPYEGVDTGSATGKGDSALQRNWNCNVSDAKLSIGNVSIWESSHRVNQAIIREEGIYNVDPLHKNFDGDLKSKTVVADIGAVNGHYSESNSLSPGTLFPITLGSEYGYGGEGIVAARTGVNISLELELEKKDSAMAVFVHGFGPIR